MAYILLIGFYFLAKSEPILGIKIFYSYYPAFIIYFDKTLPVFSYFFYYRFARYFINLPQTMPKFNKKVIHLEYVIVGYTVFEFLHCTLFYNAIFDNISFNIFSLILFASSVAIIFSFFKQKQVLYYFAITGSLFITFGAFGSMIAYQMMFAGKQLSFPPFAIFQVSVIFELFCFTTGLAYKARLDGLEKIKMQNGLIEKLKENEALHFKVQNIRNKIARDLHDDVGATLSSISIFSAAANQKLKNNNSNDASQLLERISGESREMVNVVSDFVWTLNPDNDNFQKMTDRMQSFASAVLSASNMRMEFNVDDTLLELQLSSEIRKNIFLIFKEAVNNAAKYSEATLVTINIRKNESVLLLEVKDNGKGFPKSESKDKGLNHNLFFGGNGIINMNARADEIKGRFKIDGNRSGTIVSVSVAIESSPHNV